MLSSSLRHLRQGKNTTDTVCFISISQFVWGRRGLDVVREHFDKVLIVDLPWPFDHEQKKKARAVLKQNSFDYLISYWNGLLLLEREFTKAAKGAINIHPAPPEHPGLGMFSYLRLFPEKRTHHGSTLHEINKKLDNGLIYNAERFPVLPRVHMTDAELYLTTGNLTLKQLRAACEVLATGAPTSALTQLSLQPEAWGKTYFSAHDEEEWLKPLAADDPTRDLNIETGAILLKVFGAPAESMRTP